LVGVTRLVWFGSGLDWSGDEEEVRMVWRHMGRHVVITHEIWNIGLGTCDLNQPVMRGVIPFRLSFLPPEKMV
jgi:hypothetical protein